MEIQIDTYTQQAEDYRRIEQAIRYLEEHFLEQPDLSAAAASVGLSEFHFQRLFTRWVGISPKRFLQYLTKEHAKSLLRRPVDLLEATYASGLSSPGRLHDLFVATEAVTPGEYKTHGAGLTIQFGFHPTPFGECLLARTSRGICGMAFVEPGGREQALKDLRVKWRRARLEENPQATAPLVAQIFSPPGARSGTLNLLLNGTNFQIKVWEALLRIPSGSVVTYEDIALSIGMPGSARAVGGAVAANPVAVIIPCHRVIRKDGEFGGYHWGMARKKALLGWEMAQAELH
ncbi:MAG TPA: methylated-DNA--[protein]-cysteine S-methyltransferase [Anaerolineaceae bacterium]|nr:methylated-DNA--[protein]-cysteine S-methyltransferase [Anaerolineaceae bacterium]